MQESRARKIKIGLAGLVVLGVGVAATSAMWSDDVGFQGDVTSSKFNLQGSLDGSTKWLEGGTGPGVELVIPTAADLSPGESFTSTVYVKNTADSTHAAKLEKPRVTVDASPEFKAALTVTADYADQAAAAAVAPDGRVAIVVEYVLTPQAGTSAIDNLGLQGQRATFTLAVTGSEIVP